MGILEPVEACGTFIGPCSPLRMLCSVTLSIMSRPTTEDKVGYSAKNLQAAGSFHKSELNSQSSLDGGHASGRTSLKKTAMANTGGECPRYLLAGLVQLLFSS